MKSDAAASVSVTENTSASLIARAQLRDDAAWQRLATLYTPMVYRWTRKAGLQAQDAQDVVQNVFMTLAADIHRFRRVRPGDSFRGWLWTISRHKILDRFRARQVEPVAPGGSAARLRFEQIAIPEFDAGDPDGDRRQLQQRVLTLLREEFEDSAWQAFLRIVVHGDRPADVARDLGISIATAYRVKFRVLARLRAELEGL
jgi:RNA polymerase sigma-70 factor (ECF subfamily)